MLWFQRLKAERPHARFTFVIVVVGLLSPPLLLDPLYKKPKKRTDWWKKEHVALILNDTLHPLLLGIGSTELAFVQTELQIVLIQCPLGRASFWHLLLCAIMKCISWKKNLYFWNAEDLAFSVRKKGMNPCREDVSVSWILCSTSPWWGVGVQRHGRRPGQVILGGGEK